jgi:arylamine N-acetyltransferase
MQLEAYLERVRFEGEARVDLDTLVKLHRQHLLCIPYENLDVQLGQQLDLDLQRIYSKIVQGRRGGWCYEMNGVFAWALGEIGFDVMRMVGGVLRAEVGDDALGNHLVLCVQLDEPWVADVGLGDGSFGPYPLRAHTFEHKGFGFELESKEGYWRFHNHKSSNASTMDFSAVAADEGLLARKSALQSTAADSPFVKNLVCQRVTDWGYDLQVGRVSKRLTPGGDSERLIDSADELLESLYRRFDLDVPEIAGCWDAIVARHEEIAAGEDRR